jgi:hypothetical protein
MNPSDPNSSPPKSLTEWLQGATIGILKEFVISVFVGILWLAIHQMLFSPPLPPHDEYFWSKLALQNYTLSTCVLVSISALLIAYKMEGNPVVVGFGTVAIFPIIVFIEAAVYRGSHNLIPFELIVYAAYGFFPICGAGLGWVIRKRTKPVGY